jgi:hypothetical protein
MLQLSAIYNQEYLLKTLQRYVGDDWQDKLLNKMLGYIPDLKIFIQTYRPDLKLSVDDEPGMAYIDMSNKLVHINIKEFLNNFVTPTNAAIIDKYYYNDYTGVLRNILKALLIHEIGHTYITCSTEQVIQIHELNKKSIPLKFFHHINNIVDDTILQNRCEILFPYNSRDIYSLEVFGQGINSYINYADATVNEPSMYNSLYFLILYSYRSVLNKFSHRNDSYFPTYDLYHDDKILTTKLIHEFEQLKFISDNYERTIQVYKFAEKFYEFLSEQDKQNMNLNESKSFEERLLETLDKLETNNINKLTQTISNTDKKEIGNTPIQQAGPVPLEDLTVKTLKSLRGSFYDALRKIILEDDSGTYTNLKQGKVNEANIYKESISNKVFKQDIKFINNPDLQFIFIIDVSSSMTSGVKFRNKRLHLYDYSFMIAASLGESIVQNFPTSLLKYYTFSDAAAFCGDYTINNFDYDYLLQKFNGNNMGGGTDPETVLQVVVDEIKQSTYKDKLVIYLTDGQFYPSSTITDNINYLQNNSLLVVINLTGRELKIFKDNIVLSYDDSNINNLGEDLVSVINERILEV